MLLRAPHTSKSFDSHLGAPSQGRSTGRRPSFNSSGLLHPGGVGSRRSQGLGLFGKLHVVDDRIISAYGRRATEEATHLVARVRIIVWVILVASQLIRIAWHINKKEDYELGRWMSVRIIPGSGWVQESQEHNPLCTWAKSCRKMYSKFSEQFNHKSEHQWESAKLHNIIRLVMHTHPFGLELTLLRALMK